MRGTRSYFGNVRFRALRWPPLAAGMGKADLIVAWVRLPFLTDAIKNSGLGEG